jgi:galactokinase
VNLIGDHTDYTGGLVLPMAIDRWTEIHFEQSPGAVELTSDDEPGRVEIGLPFHDDPRAVEPGWGRYVAAVAAEMPGATGIRGRVTTTVPVGAGLSSSAALEVATALALGFEGSSVELAELGRRAEHRATGVPTGIMDQLCIAAAVAEHALLIDCHDLSIEPVPIPADLGIAVIHVAHRTLEGSGYADRAAECASAEESIGPLRLARPGAEAAITDPTVRRRARHVLTENERVRAVREALGAGDLVEAGRIVTDGHRSLRDDFEVSTPAMDAAVERLIATPGVFGARMTGGGFGGCVVALCAPGTDVGGWSVRSVGAAALVR